MAKVKVDLCVIQDVNSAAEAFLGYKGKITVPTIVIVDQTMPPSTAKISELHKKLRIAAEGKGLPLYYGKGMCAQLLCSGIAKPEQTIVVCDPAACGAGAIGATVICGADTICDVLESGVVETGEKTPVFIEGTLAKGVNAKNLGFAIAKKLGANIKGKGILIGTAAALTAEEKIAICAVVAKAGACYAKFADITSGAVTIDAGKVVEMAALPGGYTEIKPIEEIAPVEIKSVYIGGTVGGNFEDIKQVAMAIKGRKIHYVTRLIVSPATPEIYCDIADAGYIGDILDAGGLVINHCGAANVHGRLDKDESMVTNDVENCVGYAGFDTSKTYVTSTAAAIEVVMAGTLGKLESSQVEGADSEESTNLTFTGRCWKFGDDIDTDIIIPIRHLNHETMAEIASHAFEPLRPEIAALFKEGDIIVAGENFGCGSSREHAAAVIKQNGIHCVIAKSFARIFFRNAINNGLMLIDSKDLPDEVKEGDIISVDMGKQTITANGKVYAAPSMPANLSRIIKDGGLVENVMKRIEKGQL